MTNNPARARWLAGIGGALTILAAVAYGGSAAAATITVDTASDGIRVADADADRDADGDGVADAADNCVHVANSEQPDGDGDGIGDACDADRDGDGFDDAIEVRGGGCDAGGSGPGGSGRGGALALVGLVGLALIALRRRRAAGAALAVLGLAVGATGVARAQSPVEARDFDVERFRWTAARSGIVGTESGAVISAGSWDLGMWVGSEDDALILVSSGYEISLVSRRSTAALVAAFGIADRIELGVALPVVLEQLREAGAPGVSGMFGSLSAGFGDIALSPKLAVVRQDVAGFAVAVIAGTTLPTGRSDYRGERTMTFTPTLAVSRASALTVAGNLGWRMRELATIGDLRVDDELFVELGVAYQVDPVVGLELGASGATAADSPMDHDNQNHAELRAGATFRLLDGLLIEAIAGAGVHHGFGTPDWRGVLGVRYGR